MGNKKGLTANSFTQKMTFLLVSSSVALTGCTSMLSHYRFSDAEIRNQAGAMALAVACVEKGLAPGQMVYEYGYAVGKVYEVSVYNKHLYSNWYRTSKEANDKYFSSEMASHCAEIPAHFPQLTARLLQRYQEISQARANDMAQMGSQMASVGGNYQQPSSMSFQSAPAVPAQKNSTNHYLINTESGMRMCMVSASGYVNCN